MDIKLEALKARYMADILESQATLEVYLNNATGIGEHPQIIEEMDKLFCKMADSEGKLESLNLFSQRLEGEKTKDYK